MVHACNLSTWEVDRGGSEVEGHPQLLNEFVASLEYNMRPCYKGGKNTYIDLGMVVVLVCRMQKQEDCCKFRASLIYIANSKLEPYASNNSTYK